MNKIKKKNQALSQALKANLLRRKAERVVDAECDNTMPLSKEELHIIPSQQNLKFKNNNQTEHFPAQR